MKSDRNFLTGLRFSTSSSTFSVTEEFRSSKSMLLTSSSSAFTAAWVPQTTAKSTRAQSAKKQRGNIFAKLWQAIATVNDCLASIYTLRDAMNLGTHRCVMQWIWIQISRYLSFVNCTIEKLKREKIDKTERQLCQYNENYKNESI